MDCAVSEVSSAVVAGLVVVPEQEQMQIGGVSRAAHAPYAAAEAEDELAALDAGLLEACLLNRRLHKALNPVTRLLYKNHQNRTPVDSWQDCRQLAAHDVQPTA